MNLWSANVVENSFRIFVWLIPISSSTFELVNDMQHENALEGLLRLQLSSDAISALYLPSVLSTLSPAQFSTSTDSQIHKWATRITSLLQSKDSGARWAGICLAKKTGELRRDLAVEYAQRWINLTLPLLSVRTQQLAFK